MTQKEALEILKTGKNVFITGPAGSGKTHLLNSYIKYLKDHNVSVGITASTGIASTHIGGMTIHSWSGIGVKAHLTDNDILNIQDKSYLSKRFENVKVLIIDEISMLHHFRFDLVSRVLKMVRGNDKPFGGIQIVLCGDLFQLPPVSRMGDPETKFIYASDAWKEGDFKICYLSEQYRQKDGDALTSILNEIRAGDISESTFELIQSRMNNKNRKANPTRLFTHNADVDSLNVKELNKIKDPKITEYKMELQGNPVLADILKKTCLAPEILRLKVGAKVMCVKNNFEEGYVNGTLGTVVSCEHYEDPVILTSDDRLLTIKKSKWEVEEDGKVKASIKQYPLRLAWAITVHKSQGMSLDAVEVDLSKSFEAGMGYVALSRVRTLEGLTILGINNTAFSVNEEVAEFDRELKKLSNDAIEELEDLMINDNRAELDKIQKEFLKKIGGFKSVEGKGGKEKKISTFEITKLLLEQEKSLDEIAKDREITKDTVLSHIEKLLEQGEKINISYLKKEISRPHFKKIEEAVNELAERIEDGEGLLLSPIKNKVGANVSFLHIRLARAILGFVPKGKE